MFDSTNRSSRPCGRSAFTLVELLVVIAIIGILVVRSRRLSKPAREAARRSQCKNNLKNIGLAVLNLTDTYKYFPTGGTEPNPDVANYLRDTYSATNPFTTSRSGKRSAGARPGLDVSDPSLYGRGRGTELGSYVSADRAFRSHFTTVLQGGASHFLSGAANPVSLVDYAATVAGPTRSEIGDTEFSKYINDPAPYPYFKSKQEGFWGCLDCSVNSGVDSGRWKLRIRRASRSLSLELFSEAIGCIMQLGSHPLAAVSTSAS